MTLLTKFRKLWTINLNDQFYANATTREEARLCKQVLVNQGAGKVKIFSRTLGTPVHDSHS